MGVHIQAERFFNSYYCRGMYSVVASYDATPGEQTK